jgi:hypothetical protein
VENTVSARMPPAQSVAGVKVQIRYFQPCSRWFEALTRASARAQNRHLVPQSIHLVASMIYPNFLTRPQGRNQISEIGESRALSAISFQHSAFEQNA